jgi:hypothetical protein
VTAQAALLLVVVVVVVVGDVGLDEELPQPNATAAPVAPMAPRSSRRPSFLLLICCGPHGRGRLTPAALAIAGSDLPSRPPSCGETVARLCEVYDFA